MTETEAAPLSVVDSPTERRCVVTRESVPKDRLLRFVVGPDNAIVFDLKQNLPGRGAWVKVARQTLELAVRRKALIRAFDKATPLDADFADSVGRRLVNDALQTLSLVNKAGLVVAGESKVAEAVREGQAVVRLIALDAGASALRKNSGAAADGSPLTGPPRIELFDSAQLSLALGRPHVIHAALSAGGLTQLFLAKCGRLASFFGAGQGGSKEPQAARTADKTS